MAPSELWAEDVDDESQAESNERHPSLVMASLFLRGLISLSERPDTVSRASSRAAALEAEGWAGGAVAWPQLGVRQWGDSSKCPPCHGGPHKRETLIQARKMQALVPHILEMLQHGDTDVRTKVLVLFRNVLGHLTRDEASPIAVQLVEDLPHLFDHVSQMVEPEPHRWAPCKDSCPSAQPCGQRAEQSLLPRALVGWLLGFAAPISGLPPTSPITSATTTPLPSTGRPMLFLKSTFPPSHQESSWMRELSISLCRILLQSVVGDDEQMMKTKVLSFLVLLFFHMSDQVDSVAQVQISKLSVVQGRDPRPFGPGHVPVS